MVVAGVLVFAIGIFFLSLLIGRAGDVDRGKSAAVVILVAWGSLLYGFYLANGLR